MFFANVKTVSDEFKVEVLPYVIRWFLIATVIISIAVIGTRLDVGHVIQSTPTGPEWLLAMAFVVIGSLSILFILLLNVSIVVSKIAGHFAHKVENDADQQSTIDLTYVLQLNQRPLIHMVVGVLLTSFIMPQRMLIRRMRR